MTCSWNLSEIARITSSYSQRCPGCELETIYADETFQVCSAIVTQLVTINGFINGQQFPLVYGLLPSKSQNDYNRIFSYLKEGRIYKLKSNTSEES